MSRLTLTAPNHEKPQNKKGSYFRNYLIQRAENGTQTRDPQLGRLVLYRLSYFRKMLYFTPLDDLTIQIFIWINSLCLLSGKLSQWMDSLRSSIRNFSYGWLHFVQRSEGGRRKQILNYEKRCFSC